MKCEGRKLPRGANFQETCYGYSFNIDHIRLSECKVFVASNVTAANTGKKRRRRRRSIKYFIFLIITRVEQKLISQSSKN